MEINFRWLYIRILVCQFPSSVLSLSIFGDNNKTAYCTSEYLLNPAKWKQIFSHFIFQVLGIRRSWNGHFSPNWTWNILPKSLKCKRPSTVPNYLSPSPNGHITFSQLVHPGHIYDKWPVQISISWKLKMWRRLAFLRQNLRAAKDRAINWWLRG